MNKGGRAAAPHVQAAIAAVQMKRAPVPAAVPPPRALPAPPRSVPAPPRAVLRAPAVVARPASAILPKLEVPRRPGLPPPPLPAPGRPAPRVAQAKPASPPLPAGRRVVQAYRTEDLEAVGEDIGMALRPLFGVEDDPTTPIEDLSANLPWWTRLRLGNRGMVDELFRRFHSYGFRYHVGMSTQTNMLGLPGSHYLRTDLANGLLEGNCIAYAKGFKTLLERFGIDSEVREVRTGDQGPFVTKVTQNFIDPRVTGNIRYKNGGIIPGRYLFSNHAATWVPSVGLYYDPMIRSSYSSFSSFIDRDWALTSIRGSAEAYWLAQPQYGGNAVVLSDVRAPGFPGQTWQLAKRKGRYRG